MEVSRSDERDDTVLVRVAGEIDCYTAPELRQHLFGVVDDRPIARLDLDMAAVDFIDSTGLGVLVAALQRVRTDGGELHLRNLQRGTAKVIELTGLATAFHVGTSQT
ncbi:MAG: STAS domain-containing protein [Actinobacteria bacterium]|nr:STAS domain-containing protein [Actinomycetota bacterium]